MRSDLLAEDGFDRVFETMPPDARARVRRRVLASVAEDASGRRARSMTARAVAVYLAASLAGTGVAYASSSALPGDALYAVKIAVEEASIAAAPTESMREGLVRRAAIRRAEEIAALAGGGATDERVGAALGRFEQAASRAITQAGSRDAERTKKRLREGVERVPDAAKERARRALDAAGGGPAAPSARDERGRPRPSGASAPNGGNGKGKGSAGSGTPAKSSRGTSGKSGK